MDFGDKEESVSANHSELNVSTSGGNAQRHVFSSTASKSRCSTDSSSLDVSPRPKSESRGVFSRQATGSSVSSGGSSSKTKLKIWKKVKKFGGKRHSNDSGDVNPEHDEEFDHYERPDPLDFVELSSAASGSDLADAGGSLSPSPSAHSISPVQRSSIPRVMSDASGGGDASSPTSSTHTNSLATPEPSKLLRSSSLEGVSPHVGQQSTRSSGGSSTALSLSANPLTLVTKSTSATQLTSLPKIELGPSNSNPPQQPRPDLSPLQKRLGINAPQPSSKALGGMSAKSSTSFSVDEVSPQVESAGFPFLLTVTVVSGHSLAARDSNGLSDPYVKIKVGSGYAKAKTSVVNKTLSPIWNETYELGVYSRDDVVWFRVFDRDIIGSDDAMGRTVVSLNKLSLDNDSEMRLTLEPTEGDMAEDMGYLMVKCKLQSILGTQGSQSEHDGRHRSSGTDLMKKSSNYAAPRLSCVSSDASAVKKGGTITRSILSVTLLGGTHMPAMDENGLSDPYCKFRLGSQKWKSRVINKTLNPEWKEKFELRMVEGASDTLQVSVFDKDYASKDDFMGSCEVDISELAPDVTHNISRPLSEGEGELNFLVTITGLKDPSEFDGVDPQDPESLRTEQVLQSYSLQKTMTDMGDVGILMIKVIKATGLTAADIGGTSDPFVTIELGNSMVRTETVYKTLNPEWNKCFFLKVKDIHSVLDITVSDEDRDKSEFLGRLKIPLLSVIPGETRWYALKDEKLRTLFKGQLELQLDLVYNPVRASVRTFNPSEKRYIEDSEKFSRQILSANITRLASLVRTVSAFAEFINSLFLWKRKLQTLFAFIVFVVIVLVFDLWMVFAFLLGIFMVQYFRTNMGASDRPVAYERSAEDDSDSSNLGMHVSSDDDEEKIADKKGLRQRLQDLYNICLTVQNALNEVAGIGERIKNTFNWTIPFQSWLAMFALTVAMLVTYLIPLRFLILLWGINKFTKRLRKPNFIPNNELMDFLSRTPSDPELIERSVVTVSVASASKPLQQKKKKKR